ncbi:MAG: hypothetical protein ACM3X9_03220 [Bacillota bacterium]
MANSNKIEAIVNFVSKHPQSTASCRICREILGEAVERFNEEFAMELADGLSKRDEIIDSYYSMIR